jgi:hypothetical protein
MEGINLAIVISRKGFSEYSDSIILLLLYDGFFMIILRFYLDFIRKCLTIGVLLTNEF